jgi:hypothetical protein
MKRFFIILVAKMRQPGRPRPAKPAMRLARPTLEKLEERMTPSGGVIPLPSGPCK